MPGLPYRGMKKKAHLFRKYDRLHDAPQQAPQRRTERTQRRTRCTVAHHSTAGSPAIAARRAQCSPDISRAGRATERAARSLSIVQSLWKTPGNLPRVDQKKSSRRQRREDLLVRT